MKATLVFLAIIISSHVFSQSSTESAVLNLSKDIFRWELQGKFDSLANHFDDQLVIISSAGLKKGKTEYLADLKNGKPVHNSIDVQESSANINGSTAIVWGKGVFVVTVNENKMTLNLSYMEVFKNDNNNWKLLALHASRLAN